MYQKDMISVIVPVYNAEATLQRCVNSILAQTYRKLEVILVDDGSVDSSPEILSRYACQDNRIVIVTQGNRGQGAARNAGIERATGE